MTKSDLNISPAIKSGKSDIETYTPAVSPVQIEAAVNSINSSWHSAVINFLNDSLNINHEKLVYRITYLGLPAGTATLVTTIKKGQFSSILTVKSYPVISLIYPVDNRIETVHADNKFIFSKIQQNEGAFHSREELTINHRKKRASWTDSNSGKTVELEASSINILDTLSSVALLRTLQLKPDSRIILEIFDSEQIASVPVKIGKSEKLTLADGNIVSALQIEPEQKTKGLFRRTGGIKLWLTDDKNRVPVRIVTTVSIGTVSVDLVSTK